MSTFEEDFEKLSNKGSKEDIQLFEDILTFMFKQNTDVLEITLNRSGHEVDLTIALENFRRV